MSKAIQEGKLGKVSGAHANYNYGHTGTPGQLSFMKKAVVACLTWRLQPGYTYGITWGPAKLWRWRATIGRRMVLIW
jgi:hypothetical protein